MAHGVNQGYSATVEIRLEVNGEYLQVSQVGDQLLILQTPRDLPPTNAKIEIVVDGEQKNYPIVLHKGASSSSRLVQFVDSFAAGSTGTNYQQLQPLAQSLDLGGIVNQ